MRVVSGEYLIGPTVPAFWLYETVALNDFFQHVLGSFRKDKTAMAV